MSRLALKAGTRIGDHEILEPIARGAMGDVYRARQCSLGRTVALKVLPPGWATDPEAEARFRRELTIQTKVSHASLVTVFDGGIEDGLAYMSMELIEGPSLATWEPPDPFPLERFVEIARSIAQALQHLHARSVLHRDLKPANIMLTADGRIKVGDFGLSRSVDMTLITQVERTVGTPAYMPPEVIEGSAWSPPGDLYALGVVYYHLLSGRLPYPEGLQGVEYLQEVVGGRPIPLAGLSRIPHAGLEALVMGLLDRQPSRRPPLSRVLIVLEGLETSAASPGQPPQPPTPRPASWTGERPGVRRGLAAALFVTGVTVGLALVSGRGGDPVVALPPSASTSTVPPAPGVTGWKRHEAKLTQLAEALRKASRSDLDMTLTRLAGKVSPQDPTLRARVLFELSSVVSEADEDGLRGPGWLLIEAIASDMLKHLYRQSLYTVAPEDRSSLRLLATLERESDDPFRRCLRVSTLPYLRSDPERNQERARFEAHEECVKLLESVPQDPQYELMILYRLFCHHRDKVKVMEARQEIHGMLAGEPLPQRMVAEYLKVIERGLDLIRRSGPRDRPGIPDPGRMGIHLMAVAQEVVQYLGERAPEVTNRALLLFDEAWGLRVSAEPDLEEIPAGKVLDPEMAGAARRLGFSFRYLR